MDREELLRSPEYWMVKIQSELFNQIREYMDSKGLNQTELATELHVSKGYVSQILNGDFDHRISKLVELSLAIGKVPQINWKDIETVLLEDVGVTKTVTFQVTTGGLVKSQIGQSYPSILYTNSSIRLMQYAVESK